jgi:hypothetical protein
MTLDETVESSLERIRSAYQNRKSWDKVMLKRVDAVQRQRECIIVAKPCCGFSFSTNHYPLKLLELLLQCGGVLDAAKIKFDCKYGENGAILTKTNINSIVRKKKEKWEFKGSCFGCETLKDICWDAVKNYFINTKVGFIYSNIPNHKIQKLDQWLGIWSHFFEELYLLFRNKMLSMKRLVVFIVESYLLMLLMFIQFKIMKESSSMLGTRMHI